MFSSSSTPTSSSSIRGMPPQIVGPDISNEQTVYRALKRLLGQPEQQLAIGLLAALKAADAEELVRGVRFLILEAKGEDDGVDPEVLKEEAANRDGAA